MLLSSKPSKVIIQSLFWIIYFTKFEKSKSNLMNYKKAISKYYSKLFISPMFKLNNDILNKICCCFSYIIHYSFFQYFPKDRDYFDFRFILDCYHICFYQINGLFLSDYYIRILIESTFTTKFMSYEMLQRK